MKSLKKLPENYKESFTLNLQKDKKTALKVNIAALFIAVVMFVPAQLHISVFTLFDFSQGIRVYFLRFAVMLAGSVLYIILHEAVHGIAMKICGTEKVKYGFTGIYAFAGSDEFYNKSNYLFIALAPVLLWGLVLLCINIMVPESWFWVVYFIQITNISGAAGDFYVTAKFCRLPSDILVSDSGLEMKVFIAE